MGCTVKPGESWFVSDLAKKNGIDVVYLDGLIITSRWNYVFGYGNLPQKASFQLFFRDMGCVKAHPKKQESPHDASSVQSLLANNPTSPVCDGTQAYHMYIAYTSWY